MTDQAKFWDKTAEKYAQDAIADMDGYTYTLKRTQSYLSKSDTVLEMGCGTGSTALLLAEHVGHITGSDISPNMIRIAKDKVEAGRATNVDFVVGDVFDPANDVGPFDAVLAHNLLHLVEDLPASLTRIHGLLKPGGLFISKTFCVDPAHLTAKIRMMRAILPVMQMVGKAPFVAFMTSTDYELQITRAGFKIIETGNYPAHEPRRYVVARKEA